MLGLAGYAYSSVYIDGTARTGVSANFYPKILFAIMAFCGIILAVKGFRRQQKIAMPKFDWKNILILFALLVGYSYLMEFVGFIISSIIFMVLFMVQLGERKPLSLALTPVCGTLIVYFLFSRVFMIVLP